MKFREGFELLVTAPGGVARLRDLILSLAVRGKLVPQDPGDESAEKLLQSIACVKERLILEGKLKRDKPQPDIDKNERPFALPQGWQWSRLQSCFDVRDGTHDSPKFYERGVPLVTSKNLYAGRLDLRDTKRISPEDHQSFSIRSKVEAGDILFAMIGSIGNPCIVDTDVEFSIKNVALFKYYARHLSNPEFLLIVLKDASIRMREAASGGVQSFVSLGSIRKEVIAVPPLCEQARIVAKVHELMHLCDELEVRGRLEAEQHARLTATLFEALAASESAHALAENWSRVASHFDLLLDRPDAVDALEQTILQLAVKGMLVPQDSKEELAGIQIQEIRAQKERLVIEGKIRRERSSASITEDEEPYELPVGWTWCQLDQIAAVGTGTTPSRDNPDYFSPPTINWVTSGETGEPFIASTAQHVSDLALRETSLTVYPVHTLIVAMYGQGKTRGQISELLEPAATNQACAAIVLINDEAHHRKYVKLFFEKIYDEIRELAAGGAQPNLNVGKVKATLLPLPPLAEQARIVARVEGLRRLCADLRARLTDRQTCQANFAVALVEQTAAAGPDAGGLALAA